MSKKYLLTTLLTLALIFGLNTWFDYPQASIADASTASLEIPAKVTASSLNVRKHASQKAAQLSISGAKVSLKKAEKVTIIKQKLVDDQIWYYISFSYNGTTKKGYVLSDYTKLLFSKNVSAVIQTSSKVKIRKGAGEEKSYLKIDGKTASLKNKKSVVITKETADNEGNKWFKILFLVGEDTYVGYVSAKDVTLTGTTDKIGVVNATSLNVRKKPGMTASRLTFDNGYVSLLNGSLVTIKTSKSVEDVTWYKISFDYEGEALSGYVSGQYVKIGNVLLPEPTKTPEPTISAEPTESEGPSQDPDSTQTPTPEQTVSPTPTASTEPTPVPDSEFSSYLTSQGFPDSYKEALTKLHAAHPNWIFKAYQTGLDWNTVMTNENKLGLNLVSNAKTNGWKSYGTGAYDFSTDKFVPFDGSTWVTTSYDGVAYYMDPRNFLFQNTIFQFEALEYQMNYQTQNGVETILKNTPMANASFTYTDTATNETKTITYSQAFMEAAAASGVSPYHLASRVKQEVIRNSTTFSDSVTGTVAGYEGYYNFYNIGASNSTKAGGAIANGLNFAMGNTIASADTKAKYNLPWNNPYDAIVGGAKFIGMNYINRGQNTIYLQKFNVTPISTYSHQYMANTEAANSEAAKTYTAYNAMGVLDTVLVFNIPVYLNMPATNCAPPTTVNNPNNWLKSLSFGDLSLTPAFDVKKGGYMYNLTIDDPTITSLTLSAATVSTTAFMQVMLLQNGTSSMLGSESNLTVPLMIGENVVTILVTAQTGDVNSYVVTINKLQ